MPLVIHDVYEQGSPHEPGRKEYDNNDDNNHNSLVTERCIRLLTFAYVKSYSFSNIQCAFSTHTHTPTCICTYADVSVMYEYMCMHVHACSVVRS